MQSIKVSWWAFAEEHPADAQMVAESAVKTLLVVDLLQKRADFAPRFGQIPVFVSVNLLVFLGFHE